MFNIFKQFLRPHTYAPQYAPLTITTVNEWFKPLTNTLFEDSDILLETASEWLLEQGVANQVQTAGHFCFRKGSDSQSLQQKLLTSLIQQIEEHRLPLLLSNQHEVLLKTLPYFTTQFEDIGIINVNLNLLMAPSVDVCSQSMLHFALTRHPQCRAFHIGTDISQQHFSAFDYAEDMGCDWLTLEDVNHRNKAAIKEQLSRFISHCDKVLLTIDLASISNVNAKILKPKIDSALVFRLLRQCLTSQKLALLQLVGCYEQDIYSRTTQRLVQEIRLHHHVNVHK